MTLARPTRRVSRTYRVREDLDEYVSEQAIVVGSRTAIVERALERDFRAERRRVAQEAALMDAQADRDWIAGARTKAASVFAREDE